MAPVRLAMMLRQCVVLLSCPSASSYFTHYEDSSFIVLGQGIDLRDLRIWD